MALLASEEELWPWKNTWLLNLDRRPDRLARSLEWANDLGIELERVAAVDGLDASIHSEAQSGCGGSAVDPMWKPARSLRWNKGVELKLSSRGELTELTIEMTPGEVGCAMSHVAMWKRCAMLSDDSSASSAGCFILEDDTAPAAGSCILPGRGRFVQTLRELWDAVPHDFDVVYLGFCDRGPRKTKIIRMCPSHASEASVEARWAERELARSQKDWIKADSILAQLKAEGISDVKSSSRQTVTSLPPGVFVPTYGWCTHAYVIRPKAAEVLLGNLPVRGPIDTWLADNKWFGLEVYCLVAPTTKPPDLRKFGHPSSERTRDETAAEGGADCWDGRGPFLFTQSGEWRHDSDIRSSLRKEAFAIPT